MIVDCIVKSLCKQRKDQKDFTEFNYSYNEDYKKAGYITERRLQIVSISDEGEVVSILAEKVIPEDLEPNKMIFIHFHTIQYIYFNNHVFCATTRHNI